MGGNNMNWFNIYFDLLFNLFTFFILDLYISFFSHTYVKLRKKSLRIPFIVLYIVYSIIPSVPFSTLWTTFIEFLYIYFVLDDTLKHKISILLKYTLFTIGSSTIIYSLHTAITKDLLIQNNQDLYVSYKQLICVTLEYILLDLYINSKRISSIGINTPYKKRFNLIVIISAIALSVLSMLLGSTIIEQTNALPIVFSLLVIIIILCLSAYRQIVITLEESALNKIQLEKVKLEQDFYAKIDDSLDNLQRLQHDFKNHLIIIDGYSKQKAFHEIELYIAKINNEIAHSAVIKTPYPLLSSIINAKRQDCLSKNILFNYNITDIEKITIDDYNLITILGNILDNAITAAGKLEDGFLELSLKQIDSYLEIKCRNNHMEVITKKKDYFLSSKLPDTKIHGIGLKSVKQAVEDLNGRLTIEYTFNIFNVSILLPNYK